MTTIADTAPAERSPVPYGSGGALLISEGESLATLSRPALLGPLSRAGFVVLRGYGADLDTFSSLVQRMSVRVTLDPARAFHGKVAQKVDAGHDAVGLHCENGNTPFVPHLCWFYCEKAARLGSETTVCDGYAVWAALSATTRARFLAQPIQYRRDIGEAAWKAFLYHSLDGRKPHEQLSFVDLLGLLDGHPGAEVELRGDGSIRYTYQVPAAHPTLFDTRLAFANSLLGPSYNYQRPRITFADGSDIPQAVLAEVAEVSAAHTQDIAWQDGEVVLIDNTRVMHGRRAIRDPERTIYNALSFISIRP